MRFIKKLFGTILVIIGLFLMLASVFAFFDKESGVGVGIFVLVVCLLFLIGGGKLLDSAKKMQPLKARIFLRALHDFTGMPKSNSTSNTSREYPA